MMKSLYSNIMPVYATPSGGGKGTGAKLGAKSSGMGSSKLGSKGIGKKSGIGSTSSGKGKTGLKPTNKSKKK